jgi:hypothetical protein
MEYKNDNVDILDPGIVTDALEMPRILSKI